jgi:nicotinate-nucleotide adenylyltransferase
MRIGLFGGTFDPIHFGHLDVAHAAREAVALDVVWLIPARVPPHRGAPHASPAHRFAMVALAVQNQDGVIVSDLEMETHGASYTTATLDRVQARGTDLRSAFFIIGADAFRDISAWKDYPQVLDRCHFIVVSRPGAAASGLREALPHLGTRMVNTPCDVPSQPSILLLDAPTSPVSSTEIRRARASGEPFGGLLPAEVAAHITRHGLYRKSAPED